MASHSGSHHYGSPTRLEAMSSSSSRMSVEGSLRSISKYRIKVVAKRPLPNFNFLAPYEPYAPQALEQLQSYIHKQLSVRAHAQPQKELMNSIKPESIRLEMDNFAIPLDDPEILRDGDVIEACLATPSETSSEHVSTRPLLTVKDEVMSSDSESTSTSSASTSSSQEDSNDSTEDSQDESEASDLASNLPAEERQALLEGKRIAALLKAGVHQIFPDDEDLANAKVHSKLHEDLPRPPAPSAASIAKTGSKIQKESSDFPVFPSRLEAKSGTGSAAAAMAAFDAQKKQSQTRKATAPRNKVSKSDNATDPDTILPSFTPFPAFSLLDRLLGNAGVTSARPAQVKRSDRDAEGYGSSQKLLNISSSESDSDSDSAPSVEAIKRVPEPVAVPADADAAEHTVPPGKGTSRTKRRNLLRRKKLQFLKEAENEANFLAAKERAEHRQSEIAAQDTLVNVEDIAAAAVRDPADLTAQVGPSVTGSHTIEVVIPQQHNYEKKTNAAADGAGKKRKRHEASPDPDPVSDIDAEPPAKDRYVAARTVPPSELPRDQIPACITITRVDCEAYYEAELRKLERQQDSAAYEGTGVSQKTRAGVDPPLDLDYGEADDSIEHATRKRVKVSETDTLTPTPDAASIPTVEKAAPAAPDGPQAQLWADLRRQAPRFYADTAATQPFEWTAFTSGTRVVFHEIALHPTKRVPEVMPFIGVVERTSQSSIELDMVGPLLPTAHWSELETEPRTWTRDYHPDEVAIL